MQRFALSQLGQTVSDEWDSREIRQELGGTRIAGGPLWVKARWRGSAGYGGLSVWLESKGPNEQLRTPERMTLSVVLSRGQKLKTLVSEETCAFYRASWLTASEGAVGASNYGKWLL